MLEGKAYEEEVEGTGVARYGRAGLGYLILG
jgi:hypothetical protein